jgi:hypothetical protein
MPPTEVRYEQPHPRLLRLLSFHFMNPAGPLITGGNLPASAPLDLHGAGTWSRAAYRKQLVRICSLRLLLFLTTRKAIPPTRNRKGNPAPATGPGAPRTLPPRAVEEAVDSLALLKKVVIAAATPPPE